MDRATAVLDMANVVRAPLDREFGPLDRETGDRRVTSTRESVTAASNRATQRYELRAALRVKGVKSASKRLVSAASNSSPN